MKKNKRLSIALIPIIAIVTIMGFSLTACPDTDNTVTKISYTVTFNKNGGDTEASPATKTVTSPATTIDALPTAPTRTGYIFTKWTRNRNGNGAEFTASTTVTDNITVYAQWQEVSTGSFTVTFNKNNTDAGSADASPAQKVVSPPATTIDALPTAPMRPGYTFVKWTKNPSGTGGDFDANTTVTASITVYAQWTVNPLPGTYLLFTSDVHWEGEKGRPGIFDAWMSTVTTIIPGAEYMCFSGDHGMSSNNENVSVYWNNTRAIMELANKYVTSGFIKNQNIFILGNHEWFVPGSSAYGGNYNVEKSNTSNWAAQQITPNHTAFAADDYVIYVFGAIHTPGQGDGCLQQFAQSEIDTLGTYLAANTASTAPLFIITHHPIHSISARVTQGRPDNLVTLLNQYAAQREIYFLWGHNHSQNPKDPQYDKLFPPGSELDVLQNGATAWSGAQKQTIQFNYIAAGAMTDTENSANTYGQYVLGKGLSARIENGVVSFMYYDKTATPFPPTVSGTWNAALPTISTQPAGRTYTQSNSGGTVTVTPAKANLSVTAALPSGESPAGSLSYQWYYSTISATDPGTPIQNAIASTYDLSNLDLTESTSVGTHYYYVKVTNTNSAATGVTTASRNSNRAVITVAGWDTPTLAYNYVITGSGTSFTATKNGTTVGTANQTMANVLTAIRTDANGANTAIQFGDGTSALSTTATAAFNGSGWGAITLKGSITSTLTGAAGTVTIGDAISAKLAGSIANSNNTATTSTNNAGKAVFISSGATGTVEVVEGANISATGGNALYHNGSGTVIISGGTLTSANASASGTGETYSAGTVCCTGNTASLTISGGMVKNTASTNGFGVYMNSVDTTTTMLTLSGGTIDTAGTRAVSIIYSTSVTFAGAGPTILNDKPIYISNGNPNNLWANGKFIAESTFAPAGKTYLLSFGGQALNSGRLIVEGGAPFVNNFYKNTVGTLFTVTGSNLTY